MSEQRIEKRVLVEFCVAALQKVRMNSENAKMVSEVLVTNDARGINSHGINCLPGYIDQIIGGGMNPLGLSRNCNRGPYVCFD